ncbi:crossover junction endodeoxyribonuclease RuvC [Microgenomates group bacterium RBG_16_45_19]|nr:MAG: crossover junction endodeoxyribonuclease RuvC [Microgenomates group bacterium RBG_16_45_19]
MRVLGIDPGYGRFGWAVVDGNKVNQRLIACGCEETPPKADAAVRYLQVQERLERLIQEYRPEEAAVESLFYFKNAKTVIKVSESRGVVVVVLARAKVLVADYTPLQVKQAVTGYGRAEKSQVQVMVKAILKLETVPKPDDAADAVAVALTHFFTQARLRG